VSHHLSTVAIQPAAERQVVVAQAPPDNPARTVSSIPATPAANPSVPVSEAVPAATAGAGAGSTGMAGANVPVESVASASSRIQNAKADLSTTSGADRRLDGLDGIGGGGGGGNAGAPKGEADVAAGTANQDVSQAGLGGQTTDQQLTNDAITIGSATDGGGADAGVNADPTL
jgi:hypothetical protein